MTRLGLRSVVVAAVFVSLTIAVHVECVATLACARTVFLLYMSPYTSGPVHVPPEEGMAWLFILAAYFYYMHACGSTVSACCS